MRGQIIVKSSAARRARRYPPNPYCDPVLDAAPLSAAEIERIAREAFAASPPTDPGDWGGVSSYIRALRIGRDHRRALHWAQQFLAPYVVSQLPRMSIRPSRPYSPVLDRVSHHGKTCRYCGDPAEAIDHVWPKARGGDDHPNNLVPACTACNSWKHADSWLTDRCSSCEAWRDPSDVVAATGDAYYACRCGASWHRKWDLQHGVSPRRSSPSQW